MTKKKRLSKKTILILVGVIVSIILIVIFYPSIMFELRINSIVASNKIINSNHTDYIISQFRNNTQVNIIVSISEQEGLSNDEIRDSVLSTLSDEDFILGRLFTSGGFYGRITISGLEKLVNNPNVKVISVEGTGVASSND